jgi:transcriptional pleiotropic regulator of transition state genes
MMQHEAIPGLPSRIFGSVVRKIDSLGRVVIPAEQRRALGISEGDLIETRLEFGRVVILKVEPECALCGSVSDLSEMLDKHVCNNCVRSLVDRSGARSTTSSARNALEPATPIR